MAAAQIRPICCGSRLQPRLPSLLQISLISSLMDCPARGFVSAGGGSCYNFFFPSPSRPPPGMRSSLDVTSSLFLTPPPHLHRSVSSLVSLKPRLRWVEPQHATASYLVWTHLGSSPKLFCPLVGSTHGKIIVILANMEMSWRGGVEGCEGFQGWCFGVFVLFFCLFFPSCTACVPCREKKNDEPNRSRKQSHMKPPLIGAKERKKATNGWMAHLKNHWVKIQ